MVLKLMAGTSARAEAVSSVVVKGKLVVRESTRETVRTA
jgi:hypothetical protein